MSKSGTQQFMKKLQHWPNHALESYQGFQQYGRPIHEIIDLRQGKAHLLKNRFKVQTCFQQLHEKLQIRS